MKRAIVGLVFLVAACGANVASVVPRPSGSDAAAASGSLEPTASAAASATPSAAPSSSPTPTASPSPTPTASPSPSTSPSPTPSPTPTLAPPAADFQPIALIGTGKKVAKLSIPKGSAALATVTFKGVKRFVVTAVAADGHRNELLVDRTGSYSGTVLFDVGVDSDALSVQATGAWNIVVKPVANARTWDGASVLKGTGDDVVQPIPARGGSVTIAYAGAGAFSVWSYAEAGSTRLVSASGKISSKVPLPVGTFLIVVRATGSWTVRPSS